jgi:agmatinase
MNDDSLAEPDVAVIGLPYDGSASLKPGAAMAPARLREISRTSDPITRRGRIVEGVTLRDFGDVPVAGNGGRALSQRDYLEAVRARMETLPDRSFPIALGGDNSVSIPCLQAFARRHGPEAGVIWFDAHADLFETYDGNPDSHACALRRAMTLAGIRPERVVLVGTRSWSLEEMTFIGDQGIEWIGPADWPLGGEEDVSERIIDRLRGASAVYLSLDIDGFDPSCAPGTGYPMPAGIRTGDFFALQALLFEGLPIRALDITEIAPPLDLNDMTSFLGAQIVLETLGALASLSSP